VYAAPGSEGRGVLYLQRSPHAAQYTLRGDRYKAQCTPASRWQGFRVFVTMAVIEFCCPKPPNDGAAALVGAPNVGPVVAGFAPKAGVAPGALENEPVPLSKIETKVKFYIKIRHKTTFKTSFLELHLLLRHLDFHLVPFQIKLRARSKKPLLAY
jgi:hypothetical protein